LEYLPFVHRPIGRKKIDSLLKEKDDASKSIAEDVRKMQSLMQSAAVEAAKIVAQQAASG
jgi:phage shock protein A